MNCLLAIDVQRGFLNEHTLDIPAKIDRFIDRTNFDFVVFTQYKNNKSSPAQKQLGWSRLCNEEEVEIVLKSKPDLVVEKDTYISITTSLITFTQMNSINKFYVCGLNTDACILSTVLTLFDVRKNPVLLEDLCASTGGTEIHKNAISIMKRNIGTHNVIKSSSLIDKEV